MLVMKPSAGESRKRPGINEEPGLGNQIIDSEGSGAIAFRQQNLHPPQRRMGLE